MLVGQTASLLTEQGHEVHLLCYSHSTCEQTTPFAVHRIPDLPRYHSARSGIHYKKIALDLSLALQTAKLIENLKPDIVHAHHYEALAASVLADPTRKTPRVFHAHALFGPELPTYAKRPFRPIWGATGRLIDTLLPRRADGIIAISEQMKRAIASNVSPQTPIALVRPPFEPSLRNAEKQEVGRKHTVRMIYTGNLDEYQGLSNLLLGLQRIDSQTRERLEFQILTDSDPASLKYQVRKCRIDVPINIGPLKSWESTHQSIVEADFMVIPRTLANGFPIKMVNALATGCPLLVDYRITEELRDDEAYKIDMSAPDQVSAGIARLAADRSLRQTLGHGARAAALRLHDPQKAAGTIEDLYIEILKQSPGKIRPL